ncbi:hypothetical protein [Symmachiella dynata]|uniref:hypothetical protein n=1 Tax=Symmachiella dynata TaxID=2527995 RepID=UPI0030EDB12A
MNSNVFQEFIDFVEHGDKLTVVTLKGHLAIEELLSRILNSITGHQALISDARLSFHQKRLLVQAHSGVRSSDASWQIIQILNTLRNEIGHKLQAERSSDLIDRIRHLLRNRDSQSYLLIPNPNDDVELISHVVSFLIGFLGAFLRELE